MTVTKAITTYPRIVQIIGTNDAGEDGNARCPHCGAEGRYTIWFKVEDGVTLGAMRGCIKLFPRSAYINLYMAAMEKTRKSQWDRDIMEGVEKWGRGEITREQLERGLADIKAEKRAWMKKRGYIR